MPLMAFFAQRALFSVFFSHNERLNSVHALKFSHFALLVLEFCFSHKSFKKQKVSWPKAWPSKLSLEMIGVCSFDCKRQI